MPTPLLSDYRAAIENADLNFSSLLPISAVRDSKTKEIKFASGGFAIVFKMQKSDDGKTYAIYFSRYRNFNIR